MPPTFLASSLAVGVQQPLPPVHSLLDRPVSQMSGKALQFLYMCYISSTHDVVTCNNW